MQVSADRLRELEEKLEEIKTKMFVELDKEARLTNELKLSKTELIKHRESKDLINQHIMIEKKLIDAGR